MRTSLRRQTFYGSPVRINLTNGLPTSYQIRGRLTIRRSHFRTHEAFYAALANVLRTSPRPNGLPRI